MTSCRVWRTEKRPATVTDDHSSVEIGVSGKSAQPTPERGLIRSVLVIHMPTLRTFSGRVPRIHRDQRNAGDIRLVADERSKLPERPRGKRSSLLFAGNPDPATNASKFFDGDRRFRAFSLGNELPRADDGADIGCREGRRRSSAGRRSRSRCSSLRDQCQTRPALWIPASRSRRQQS